MEGSIDINYVFWLGTSVMLFLALGLLFLVLFYQNNFTKMKRQEAETLLKTALESEKEERQRIAKDLHDSVQGDLSAIRNYMVLLQRQTQGQSSNLLISEAKDALEKAIENTRVISNKLMPPLLETAGFSSALRDYLEQLSLLSGKEFVYKTDFSDVQIPTEYAYELFRVVQEFCQNMLKHGQISQALLSLYITTEGLSLEIIDDGVPFDFKTAYNKSNGSGLNNIQSRIKSMKAELVQREVTVGNHFVIYLKLPI
ncbi:histidine kinase [Flavobacterium azooxidireducens]|uniref:histidine kinase n=1 Tax=Flavobacterium azooxidireducens TaxID=1871076 RepID=A0ABY4KCM6_9FLAO|nr:histidine kinase [Flavobacterium azooxidireducens]UPQ78284.1 histidine kinase [Flavobacterium azooxidireducens]